MRCDTRNLLNLPRSRAREFAGSHALDLAVASRTLIAVDASTIALYAFPCCKHGKECCPTKESCCSHWRVGNWLASTLKRGHRDVRDLTRTRWYDGPYYVWGPGEYMLPLHEDDRKRFWNLTRVGNALSYL